MKIPLSTGSLNLPDDARPTIADCNDIIASVIRNDDDGSQFQWLRDASVVFPCATNAEFLAACKEWISRERGTPLSQVDKDSIRQGPYEELLAWRLAAREYALTAPQLRSYLDTLAQREQLTRLATTEANSIISAALMLIQSAESGLRSRAAELECRRNDIFQLLSRLGGNVK